MLISLQRQTQHQTQHQTQPQTQRAPQPTALPLTHWLLVGLIMAGCSSSALAQGGAAAVYRCGNSYQAKPCTGGAAVDAADPRSADQLQQARQSAQADAKLARQMTAERQAAERQAARQGGAANVGPVAARPPAKAASKPAKPQQKKKSKAVKRVKSPKVTGG